MTSLGGRDRAGHCYGRKDARCFHTEGDMSKAIPQHTTTFASYGAWRATMNIVAQGQWYIAGGFAAWLHITGYGNADTVYLNTRLSEIAPGDIEIAVLTGVDELLTKKFGRMAVTLGSDKLDVSIFPLDQEKFQQAMALHCQTLDTAALMTPKAIAQQYQFGGNEDKLQKRKLRITMLDLITAGGRLDRDTIAGAKPKMTLAEQLRARAKK